MSNDQTTLTLREYPTHLWVLSLVFIILAFVFFITDYGGALLVVSFALAGVGLFLYAETLTVTADQATGMIRLSYWAPVWRKKNEIPIHDVASVQLEGAQTFMTHGRIVVVRKDGMTIPLQLTPPSLTTDTKSEADQLRSFLGVSDRTDTPSISSEKVIQNVQLPGERWPDPTAGSPEEMHITAGVHWQVQSAEIGSGTLTRWFSPDAAFAAGFLFLAQKAANQKTLGIGWLGGAGKLLFRTMLKLYGFFPEDLPDLESAEVLAPLDPGLEACFSAFTSAPASARRVLNPWLIRPLVDWVNRYPLKTIQTRPQIFGQLVVFFSPRGTYLASLGTLIPEAVDELTTLGVELVKALK